MIVNFDKYKFIIEKIGQILDDNELNDVEQEYILFTILNMHRSIVVFNMIRELNEKYKAGEKI